MAGQADVPELYRGQINLWVEDAVVAAYFEAAWSDPAFLFLVAGGHPAVEAMAQHAMENDFKNVFGVVDRDFGSTNYDDWLNPNRTFRRFVLPVHEVENLLLDPEALVGCSANNTNKTVEQITARISNLAGNLVPYMACRATLAELRRLVLDGFSPHPRRDHVPNQAAALQFICQSDWFQRIINDVPQQVTEARVGQRLAYYEAQYSTHLHNGAWRSYFSGKELFRDVNSYFYNAHVSAQERDIDVAKAVARWQLENNRVPQELVDLRRALRQRVGL